MLVYQRGNHMVLYFFIANLTAPLPQDRRLAELVAAYSKASERRVLPEQLQQKSKGLWW